MAYGAKEAVWHRLLEDKEGYSLLRKMSSVITLGSILALAASASGLAKAPTQVSLVQVSGPPPSPLAGCSNVGQPGRNFPDAEVEPQVPVHGREFNRRRRDLGQRATDSRIRLHDKSVLHRQERDDGRSRKSRHGLHGMGHASFGDGPTR